MYSIRWDRCWNVVDRAVKRGQARKEHAIPTRLGVDEKSFARGHKYETIVTNIDKGTVGESINAKIENVKRMAGGFRNRQHYLSAIYFHCGGLDLYPYPPVKPCLRYRLA